MAGVQYGFVFVFFRLFFFFYKLVLLPQKMEIQ